MHDDNIQHMKSLFKKNAGRCGAKSFFSSYYGLVLCATSISLIAITIFDLVVLKRCLTQNLLVNSILLVFFGHIYIFRDKFSDRNQEVILVITCILLAVASSVLQSFYNLKELRPVTFWFNQAVWVINFLVISIGAFKKIYTELNKPDNTSNIADLGNAGWMAEHINSRIESGVVGGTMLLVDVRNFRIINSIFGRSVGDKLIKMVADIVRPLIADDLQIAHLSGIEFCFWIENEKQEKIAAGADMLIRSIKQGLRDCGESVNLFFQSAGVVYPKDGTDFNQLFSRANMAMENNNLDEHLSPTFYCPEMEQDLISESIYIYEIQKAIENKEFYVCYQQKRNLNGTDVHGIEALARWDSELLGDVPPEVFIPLIHKSYFTNSFTELILEKVLQDVDFIDNTFGRNVNISINIPPTFFLYYRFLDLVKEKIEKTEVFPGRLTFEITEDLFIDGIEDVRHILEELQVLGIRISLDDFGTGFSSLSYLQSLPIQELKIDKSFIDHICENERNFILVKAICDIAHANDYTIVAEGVESEEQLNMLKQTSCDLIQGYLYSKPERLSAQKLPVSAATSRVSVIGR